MVDGPQYNILLQKSFRQSMSTGELSLMVSKQLNHFIPDSFAVEASEINELMAECVDRIKNCFKWINNKYYTNEEEIFFNHLQSDHYCAFIYLLSNTAYKQGNLPVATKLFLLNKYLHGLDLYFSVQLPEVFMLVHPVGSVIGNAQYGNFFVAYQNCTIGSTFKDGKYIYPLFGDNVIMYARSAVIGSCHIESNVVIAANSFVLNSQVDANSVVTGNYPHLAISKRTKMESPFFFS